MQVLVKYNNAVYAMNECNEFVCIHDEVEISECCNGKDCACHGLREVECMNEDCRISVKDAQQALNNYFDVDRSTNKWNQWLFFGASQPQYQNKKEVF